MAGYQSVAELENNEAVNEEQVIVYMVRDKLEDKIVILKTNDDENKVGGYEVIIVTL